MFNYLSIFSLICSVLASEELIIPPGQEQLDTIHDKDFVQNNENLFEIKNQQKGIDLEVLSADSKLQLGAPWPMRGRNQYHSGQSPFIGSATNATKWRYQTGVHIMIKPTNINVSNFIVNRSWYRLLLPRYWSRWHHLHRVRTFYQC